MNEDRKPFVGKFYIGNKEHFRMMKSPKDYSPFCLHRHETELEALECQEALEKFDPSLKKVETIP